MKVDYEKTQIAEGVSLDVINDSKFSTNFASVRFVMPFRREDASAISFVPSILTTLCERYPTKIELNRKLLSLYNTTLGLGRSIVGDNYVVTMYVNCISDKNAYDGERVTEEAVSILIDCILNPKVTDGKFDQKEFDIIKLDLLSTIESEINNKRDYAQMLANEIIYVDEPSATKYYGTRETAEALTNEQVYECYKNMLSTADIEITIGGSELDNAKKLLCDAFSKLPRKSNNIVYYSGSKLKKETAVRNVKSDVQQTRLIMAYKGGTENVYVDKLFSAMFGATPTSRLFMNVREKLQLCYSCSANLAEYKKTLMVTAGIDENNCEKAAEEIGRQLKSIADGDFTDDELFQTKLMITGAFRANYDGIYELCMWYNVQNRRGTCYTPDEVIDIFNSVTREQIIECAKSYKLDTVFTLTPQNQPKGPEQ